MVDLLPPEAVMVAPAAVGIAPPRGQSAEAQESFRVRGLKLTCTAGLARLQQISPQPATVGECPLALSLIAGPGADEAMLHPARLLPAACPPFYVKSGRSILQ